MNDQELADLLRGGESDRVEFKESAQSAEKIREAVCAFANDLPGDGRPGVVFVGVKDDGSCADLDITDQLQTNLGGIGRDGDILPSPNVVVRKRRIDGCELAVVIVRPSSSRPVRYRGRTCVRRGPRQSHATPDEELRLAERTRAADLPFDVRRCDQATIDELNLRWFREEYLPEAIASDVLERNQRSVEDQLTVVRFATAEQPPEPTNLGVLAAAVDPRRYLPGAYIQFVRLDGEELSDPILDQKEISGPLPEMLLRLSETLRINISTATDITAGSVEVRHPDYPLAALEQLARNAVLHRAYEGTNAPVRVSWFRDRVEIHSPGGPYGQVNRSNFGKDVTDYRNPHLAEVMKNLGFVQKFGFGIPIARAEMEKNGNPPIEFEVEDTHVLALLRGRR